MPKLKIPSWLAVVLGVVLGLVGGLNVATFGLAQPWADLVTFGCAALASIGIAPLAHAALRNALHLSYPLALSLAGIMTTLTAAVTASTWSASVKGLVVGLLTAGAGILAGPNVPTTPVATPKK